MQPCAAMSAPSTTSLTTTTTPDACHTAVESDECYGHVVWAMEKGIYSYPSWYPGLSPQSRFVDFQASMHLSGHGFGTCPQPCRGLGGQDPRRLANVKAPRDQSTPSPGSVAEMIISVPVATPRNSNWSSRIDWSMESDADLMATMRAVGQTLLGLNDDERKLVRVKLDRAKLDSAGTPPKAASVSFAASVPAERASSIRIKTAEEVPKIFHAESIVSPKLEHEIVPASGEIMKSYLLLSDVRHQVVAIVTDTLPAQVPQPSPKLDLDKATQTTTLPTEPAPMRSEASRTKPSMPTEPSPTQSPMPMWSSTPEPYIPTESSKTEPSMPMLRGTTTRPRSFDGEGEFEASGAVGHSLIVSAIAFVCTFSA